MLRIRVRRHLGRWRHRACAVAADLSPGIRAEGLLRALLGGIGLAALPVGPTLRGFPMRRVLAAVVLLLVTVPQACRRDDATAPPPIAPSVQSTAASAPVIAFASNRDGNYEIYVMNADGSAQTRLTSNTGTDNEPSWSYDGRRIAFVGDGAFGVINVMQADGSGLTALRGGTDPTWSPDGRIAFTSNQTGTYQIYVMQADGSAVTRLTNNTHFDVSPSWSPDGRQIAFQSDRDGNLEIYVMNADGTAQTRLTNNAIGDGVDGDPSWSPDSRRIAFTSTRDGDSEVYVMNADGSGQTRLTNSAGFDGDPTWSASGLRIAFTSRRNGNNEIYVMNSDGSAPTRITNNVADEGGASWSPAGQVTSGTLAFVVQPPASVHVGATISPPVQVAVQDTLGNAVPGATNAVTLSLASNPSGATLLGTTTVEAVDGIASFADLRLDRAGTAYTLVARAAGLTDGTSAAFEVVPSNRLAFIVQPPADVD